jgi:hypothetical protein
MMHKVYDLEISRKASGANSGAQPEKRTRTRAPKTIEVMRSS